MTLTNLKIYFSCMCCWELESFSPPLARIRFFYSFFCHFFSQIKISSVCFSFFRTSETCFLKSYSYQPKELSFAHYLVSTRKKLRPIAWARIFRIFFLRTTKIQTLFFSLLLYFGDFYSNLSHNYLKNSSSCIFWL